MLQFAFFAAALVAAYFYWVRPLLRARPEFKELYANSDSFWQAAGRKLASIKGKLAAALGMALSAIIAAHDFLIPLATGVDWTPIRALLPDWAWPVILFAAFALISWFRTLTDKRQDRAVAAVEAGASPEYAAVVAETTRTPVEAAAVVQEAESAENA